MGLFILLNNFIHDFAVALWLCSVIMAYFLEKEVVKDGSETALSIFRKMYGKWTKFFWLSLAVVFITGGIRAVSYRRFEWIESAGNMQIGLLLFKHILFLVIVVTGIIYWLKLKKRVTLSLR